MASTRNKAQRIAFTMARLERLAPPAKGRVYIHDTTLPGLALCVTAAGSKTYYLYRWYDGRPAQIPVGRFPALNVEGARKLVQKWHQEILAKGLDAWQASRKAKREEPNLGDLWTHWREKHGSRLKSIKEWERIYNVYLSPWANRRLATVKKGDVAGLHMRLGDANGRVQANRVLSLVKMLFAKADGLGWSGENPAAGVPPFPETARDRYLTAAELPRFFQALAEEPNPHLQAFFVLCLFTTARRGTVQRMKWADLDLKCPSGPNWRIPETKRGRPQTLPLVPVVVEVLEKLQTLSDGSEYVFPAIRAGKTGTPYLRDPMPAWRRLCKRAGLANLTIHDLRRSGGSWAAISGISMRTIAEFLGHAPGSDQTAIYARLSQDAERAGLTAAVGAMTQLGGKVRFLEAIDVESKPSEEQDEPTEF